MKGLYDQSPPQMGSVRSHTGQGWIRMEGRKGLDGIKMTKKQYQSSLDNEHCRCTQTKFFFIKIKGR